jgi:hypothetical protein
MSESALSVSGHGYGKSGHQNAALALGKIVLIQFHGFVGNWEVDFWFARENEAARAADAAASVLSAVLIFRIR